MVKEITPSMIEEISLLERESFSSFYSDSVLLSTLKAPSFFGLASVDNKVLGYVFSTVVLDEANIDRIAVKKEYRNQKIATKLLIELENRLKEKGVKKVLLEVRRSNAVAIKLYLSLGYKKIYERKNYYENGEDALIYIKNL
ncbi:MAG: ribosomal protein S18-alanine N-acetyltransferase [Clostridia bacterium]|nr:ribosomal protein S18-alanine N-acetyltransferase [Clostridia bacterium]